MRLVVGAVYQVTWNGRDLPLHMGEGIGSEVVAILPRFTHLRVLALSVVPGCGRVAVRVEQWPAGGVAVVAPKQLKYGLEGWVDPEPTVGATVPLLEPATPKSRLVSLRPLNAQEAMEAFFEGGLSQAPKFVYAAPDMDVANAFKAAASKVCFKHLEKAVRILECGGTTQGTLEATIDGRGLAVVGEELMDAQDLRAAALAYLQRHSIHENVEISLDAKLSAPRVSRNVVGNHESYMVCLPRKPCPRSRIQSMLDHELGTHLLRFKNDERQVWHGSRQVHGLRDPGTTEEGLATINEYMSMPNKVLREPARQYVAACRGAQLGFVELFRELLKYSIDLESCWRLCCKVKQGMLDTSLPGAAAGGQAYFKGAVEILLSIDEVNVTAMYSGCISFEDVLAMPSIMDMNAIKLPHFLGSPEKMIQYKAHCKELLHRNFLSET